MRPSYIAILGMAYTAMAAPVELKTDNQGTLVVRALEFFR